MRILIVGGGVAGLTLAALLGQRGEEPVVVERAGEYGRAGYSITLWPLGGRVLRGLGLEEGLRELGTPLGRTVMRDGRGRVVRSLDVGTRMARYGEPRTLARSDLVDLLRSYGGGIPVRTGQTVERIEQDTGELPGPARVTFGDGSEGEFDLVAGADGIRSETRRLVFGEIAPDRTGFVLLWWWQDADGFPREEVAQFSGAGRFLGVYPVGERVSCVALLPEEEALTGRADTPESQRKLLWERFAGFGGEPLRPILDGLDGAERFDRTEVADLRIDPWHRGRVVLIGDAAAAVLPTVGIGASLAMESAAVLADELSRADAWHLSDALRFYERRRRDRVVGFQKGSRAMFKMMATRRPTLAVARDAAAKLLPEGMMLGGIEKQMRRPI